MSAIQRERVLSALRFAGERGLTQVDYLLPNVIDGGPPITRVGARIHELIGEGHRIESVGRRGKCVIYRLAEHGTRGANVQRCTATRAPAALFDESVGVTGPASPYDAEVS